MTTIAYAAVNSNSDVRAKSSSGAVFYELANWTISNGGVVYGAKFDNKTWKVVHGHTETLSGINDFLGSKYVQSDICNEYSDVKSKLDDGRLVLFSGTPCQIAGLKTYLGKEYKQLITVDFICHGVPSPSVWTAYIDNIARGRKVVNVNFRDKTEGWMSFSLKIDFSDGTSYRKTQHDDLYMKGFLQNIYLRPSCYHCGFKTIDRCSDITLADYWGINEDLPDMFDDGGASIILIHSNTGQKLWLEIQNLFEFREVTIEEVIKRNRAVVTSVERPSQREKYYQMGGKDFHQLKRMTDRSLQSRILKKVREIIKGMKA